MLITSFYFSDGKHLFEGDIKPDTEEKYVSNGQGAAVSCSTHRIRCDRLWDGAVIPYLISRGLRKSLLNFVHQQYYLDNLPLSCFDSRTKNKQIRLCNALVAGLKYANSFLSCFDSRTLN